MQGVTRASGTPSLLPTGRPLAWCPAPNHRLLTQQLSLCSKIEARLCALDPDAPLPTLSRGSHRTHTAGRRPGRQPGHGVRTAPGALP